MRTLRVSVALLVMLASVLAIPAMAEEAKQAPKPIAEMSVSPARIDWLPTVEYEHLVLTVAGPNDLYISQELEAGQALSLSLFDPEGNRLPNGSYVWELRVIPRLDPGIKLRETEVPKRSLVQSGNFFIKDGSFMAVEPLKRFTAPRSDSPVRNATAKDSIETGNLIVQKNACIGESCSTSDADVPVLKLKAPEIGILFDDVETVSELVSASRNWALVANPSGADQFSLFDMDNIQALFTVVGDAPANSLYIASNGNVGLGTSTPGAKLHLYGSATADAIASAGPDPVSGPAFNFGYAGASFGRGVGFLNVRPDASATAPNPSLRFLTTNVERMIITNTGKIGVGTSSPEANLHAFSSNTSDAIIGLGPNPDGSPGTESAFNLFYAGATAGRGSGILNVRPDSGATAPNPSVRFWVANTERMIIDNEGFIGLGVANPTSPIHHSSGAILTAGGTWQNASSRDLKRDIAKLAADEAITTLQGLEPVKFSYKVDPKERHVGFIAEDVPELVAAPDRQSLSPMDLVAVLTKVVQEQQKTIEELSTTVGELRARLDEIEKAP